MTKEIESRDRYRVTRAFTAFRLQSSEGFAPDPVKVDVSWEVFADPEHWKGWVREGRESVQFFLNLSRLYVDRDTFRISTEKVDIASQS